MVSVDIPHLRRAHKDFPVPRASLPWHQNANGQLLRLTIDKHSHQQLGLIVRFRPGKMVVVQKKVASSWFIHLNYSRRIRQVDDRVATFRVRPDTAATGTGELPTSREHHHVRRRGLDAQRQALEMDLRRPTFCFICLSEPLPAW